MPTQNFISFSPCNMKQATDLHLHYLLELPTVQIVISQCIEPSPNTLLDGVAAVILLVRIQTFQLHTNTSANTQTKEHQLPHQWMLLYICNQPIPRQKNISFHISGCYYTYVISQYPDKRTSASTSVDAIIHM